MVFPIVMYGYKSWTIRRLRAKELMFSNCGAGKTLESLFDSKKINPEYLLEGLMLKLKLQ